MASSPHSSAGVLEDVGADDWELVLASEERDLSPRSQDLRLCVDWIKERIVLSGFTKDFWKLEHGRTVLEFLSNPGVTRLFVYVDRVIGLCVQFTVPTDHDSQSEIMFFMRKPGSTPTIDTIAECIQYGRLAGNAISALSRVAQTVFAPLLAQDSTWPEATRNDMRVHYQKFMTSLSETVNRPHGVTILFVPDEDLSDLDACLHDKELAQRLEVALISWTRQIKEVLGHAESVEREANEGPLEEVAFWEARAQDLSRIQEQLSSQKIEHIVSFLRTVGSNYLGPFDKLAQTISVGHLEAQDNLKFLSALKTPCVELRNSGPGDIPKLIPVLVNTIRMIWSLSRFYNTPERMIGLLRRVSNEIMNRCRSAISVQEIFGGNVVRSMDVLQKSIRAGDAWRRCYQNAVSDIARQDAKDKLDFDESNIFARINAFVQRCRELLEVCEAQMQFGRRGCTGKSIPVFGGVHGSAMSNALIEIEKGFEHLLSSLANLQYNVLDIKGRSQWHEDYSVFREAVRELEAHLLNVFNQAFANTSTVDAGVELCLIMNDMAVRDAMKGAVIKKKNHVFALFMKDLEFIRHEFDMWRRDPPIPQSHPFFAGAAIWAGNLCDRAQHQAQFLKGAKQMSKDCEKAASAAEGATERLVKTLEAFSQASYESWIESIDYDLDAELDKSLLTKVEDGLIECNFSKPLLTCFTEAACWEAAGFAVPSHAADMCEKSEQLRLLRNNVLLFVSERNALVSRMGASEKLLFRDHLRRLDKTVNPGLNELAWRSEDIMAFVSTCRQECKTLDQSVRKHETLDEEIAQALQEIREMIIPSIDRRRVYSKEEFEQLQNTRIRKSTAQFVEYQRRIVELATSMFGEFTSCEDRTVLESWSKYVRNMDVELSNALLQSIKRSMNAIEKSFSSETEKIESIPQVFRVFVVLEKPPGTSYMIREKIQFHPTVADLRDMVLAICSDVVSSVSDVERLILSLKESVRSPPATPPESYYERIKNDDEILRTIINISSGMESVQSRMEQYVELFEQNFREAVAWEADKDAFMRRYKKLHAQTDKFVNIDADISRYTIQQQLIQNVETITPLTYVQLDCSRLKNALVAHCNAWQNKFFDMLNAVAKQELFDLLNVFSKNRTALTGVPSTLKETGEKMALLNKLKGGVPEMEARFGPLESHYVTLKKWDVSVPEEEFLKMKSLHEEWQSFKALLARSEVVLANYKEEFRSALVQRADEFQQSVETLREEFSVRAPYEYNIPVPSALELLTDFRKETNELIAMENEIQEGLAMFKLERRPAKELRVTVKELDLLDRIWHLADEWEQSWERWKTSQFFEIKASEMEEQAQLYLKRVLRLRETRQWDIWIALKDRMDQFRRTMPLIQHLKNPALRDRHWDMLMDEVGRSFDPRDKYFNMEKVFEMGLDSYADAIADLSLSATKELAIEESLDSISATWESMELDIGPYRDTQKLKGAEAVFQAVEDNQVTVSAMKSSPYFRAFEKAVEDWEKTLSRILETVEMLLLVQRHWMYLESIFAGAGDIRKQLPSEAAVFEEVNARWKFVMSNLYVERNVLKGTKEDLLPRLLDMSQKLERIQKSLEQYLETKRNAFPRFYFLSNDDLLEILGQAKDPQAVQPHLKKCFANIHALTLLPPGKDGRKTWEAYEMISGDGEVTHLTSPVAVEGHVESWLGRIEVGMQQSIRKLLLESVQLQKRSQRDRVVKDWAVVSGQLLLTSSQICWTSECERALREVEKGNRKALKHASELQRVLLGNLSALIQTRLTRVQRLKLNALLIIEVHARDVMDRLVAARCSFPTDFEWLSQLRFYWDKDAEHCIAKQTSTTYRYGYEYIGNSGRLVITPLTDRCYMTLMLALHMKLGGAPQGPAGTGKTETVKDLGKALAKFVLVFNCSEGLDYQNMGRMFSGLAQTGSWSCFDEFNRIDIEVLSVVAQQIHCILSAVASQASRFIFEGVQIELNPTCGFFITMNPGYAGRTELPDNLKSLFRPVSLMVPDAAQIAEIMLFSEGFQNVKGGEKCKELAGKIVRLYELCKQQLSKQDHYDFGLRAVKSVLIAAGTLKRAEPEMMEDVVMLRSIQEMNVPKLVAEDLILFNEIVHDLFPGVDIPQSEVGPLQKAVEKALEEQGLQVHPAIVSKVLQLYETKSTRHGVMIVGETGAGKTVCWKTLQKALNILNRDEVEGFPGVRSFLINPKAVTLSELFGDYDLNTREWTDGVLSNIMRSICSDEKPDLKWMILDGPVDTLWIESMNTVLDDNKMLTLINGERISMTPEISLLFEVSDLSQASPATVSRAGMVYMDQSQLGWQPFVDSWMARRSAEEVDVLGRLFLRHVQNALDNRSRCSHAVPTSDLNVIMSLCNLYDALATEENGVNKQDTDFYGRMIELWFYFAVVWSIGAGLDEDGRRVIDMFLRDIEGQYPTKDSVYEYFVDPKKRSWTHWAEKLPQQWKYAADAPFHRILVPTVDTARMTFLLNTVVHSRQNLLLTGTTGVGKTAIIQGALSSIEDYSTLTLNLSARTSAHRVQTTIEAAVEKRTMNVFVPRGGKRLAVFVDDLNMPAKDQFGSQPPLELLRQWIDNGFWYDTQKQTPKYVQGLQLVAAMGLPGGGRTTISSRLQSRFHLINITFPADDQLHRIFATIIGIKFNDFSGELKPLGPIVARATLEVYKNLSKKMLPTPQKSHYVFNLRDMSNVFQGLMRAHKDFHDTHDVLIRLWVHECTRVFHDRLVSDDDRTYFNNLLSEVVSNHFQVSWRELLHGGEAPLFGDFLREMEVPVYEEITELDSLKSLMMEKLEDYGLTPVVIPMDLVLFKDALSHICRIVRILSLPRGNALLVGMGGSGRRSLARLAVHVAGHKLFEIEITRQYRLNEFHEDIQRLYEQAGVHEIPSVFLFSDTQILEETFLEDINSMLSSGDVPGLYSVDDLAAIREAVRDNARAAGVSDTPTSLFDFFLERVRNNLHIVLCMSPVGDAFHNRIRQFPALISCTTIDWFSTWPDDALEEVALHFLDEVDIKPEEMKKSVAQFFVQAHSSALVTASQMQVEMKRTNYVTPTNYLELVRGYCELFEEKREELTDSAAKLSNGLKKLDEARGEVQTMSKELFESKMKVAEAQKECEGLLVVIVQERRMSDEQAREVAAEGDRIGLEEEEVEIAAKAAQAELDEAMPELIAANKALETLSKKDIAEIKAYAKPPPLVELVLNGVMYLMKKEPSWASAKRELSDANFLLRLVQFEKDSMSDLVLKKIERLISDPNFQPDIVGRVSVAAKSLCLWVIALHRYGCVYRVVAPKRDQAAKMQRELEKKQAALRQAKERLQQVTDRVIELKMKYDDSVATKERLRREMEETETKLSRAEKLVEGLASERERWQGSIGGYEKARDHCVGDALVAAAFLSYAGPFPSSYRTRLVDGVWRPAIHDLKIPLSEDFSVEGFLGKPVDIRDWQIQGLPTDSFSTENGLLVTRGRRWPLMVDPQAQANSWIKTMEKDKGLQVINLGQSDFLRTLENAVKFGTPVLVEDVGETIDPALDPILCRAWTKDGARMVLRLGDKELDYNPEFRIFFTTKLPNPHFAPEISTRTTIVNFTVKEQGLEAQLLGRVVRKERPELEEQKDTMVMKVATAKKQLLDLEDEILRLLFQASGSLLDDETLVNALQRSKSTTVEIKQQLDISEQTEAKIDAAREAYLACATRASLLYFVLADFAHIDPMYQFSLDSYIDLFNTSMERSPKSDEIKERIQSLNDFHTYAVYSNTCRGLFEKHKLLFSFQMCVKILQAVNKLHTAEYNFFLRGGQVLDKETQPRNPCRSWLPEASWDHITEVEKLPNFNAITSSFDTHEHDWKSWYFSAEPENTPLPGEWESKCNELQRMIVVRCLRPDRVASIVTRFISTQPDFGRKFVEPPVFDLGQTYNDSNALMPLLFVLSPGVDPKAMLAQLAEKCGMSRKFTSLALGQGQAAAARRLIEVGMREGHWVFLANCHLMMSWMPELEKLVLSFPVSGPNTHFRLWLSSNPHPAFPVSVLQRSVKITTEPPKGIKANLLRLYGLLSESRIGRCLRPEKYKKLLFALVFFHSILLERRKFLSLGWNVPYDFNDSDFDASENLLRQYLDQYEITPWSALKFIIGEINYGGRVTEDFDRRLLREYLNQYFCEDALDQRNNFRFSELYTYYIPDDGPLQSYRDYIMSLPTTDKPEAFGQHQNADVASQVQQANILLSSLALLSPSTLQAAKGAESEAEEKVLSLASDILGHLPNPIDLAEARKVQTADPTPLNTVLVHEITGLNSLLEDIRSSLDLVMKGIRGELVMGTEMDEIFQALVLARVPQRWQRLFASQKPLGSWTRNLGDRVAQLQSWLEQSGPPNVFWLGGFSFPTGFLTALLQMAARKNNVSIDRLSWEFVILGQGEVELTSPPAEGAYVKGLYLEGASWNHATMSLQEPSPMELLCEMPIIHFKPVESEIKKRLERKSSRGTYEGPLYVSPVRVGTREQPAFVLNVDLPCGAGEAGAWLKRGTALLLSTAD